MRFCVIFAIVKEKMKKLYLETYGCQMNFADSEVVASILKQSGYLVCSSASNADLILLNTCSIRENAEQRVLARANELLSLKKKKDTLKIGIIGCMAERMQLELFEKLSGIDLLAGPDSYRHLPSLINELENDVHVSHVVLSTVETYEDIDPLRLKNNSITAFVSIMRGCNNFCSYCVVPYTRGRERSRPIDSIFKEVENLYKDSYKEITFLGQNVNSYIYIKGKDQYGFSDLLAQVAEKYPSLRFRFATSHPKDLSDELIEVIASHSNICRSIHLPLQSGSDVVLKKMNRKYTLSDYLKKVEKIKKLVPEITISTDIISGFCEETEDDHKNTLSVMKGIEYYYAFMFKYSERPGTAAAHFKDDVAENVKARRLQEIIELQQKMSLKLNKSDIGKTFEVLVEGFSKRSNDQLFGRTSQNKVVVFDKKNIKVGDMINVKIDSCTTATLKGNCLF